MNKHASLNPYNLFWADITPCEHLVQIYPSDEVLLDALEGFVVGGFTKGEAIVLIATPGHRAALNHRLVSRGFNLEGIRARQMYLTLDAEESLQKFMIKGWPDDVLFKHFIQSTLSRAGGKRVRAFGEMVALLWAHGHGAAMHRLEELWHKVCHKEELALFCAYPRSGFTEDAEGTIRQIWGTHSRVIA
jgi:hypothetical protein